MRANSPFLISLIAALTIGLPGHAATDDILLADFEGTNYGQWKTEGTAFGPGPARGTLPGQMPVTGFLGKALVNSFYRGDSSSGKLISPTFRIQRRYLNYLIGGGGYSNETYLALLVDGREVRRATGPNTRSGGSEALEWASWEVAQFLGREAEIHIVDQRTGGWGHLNVDHIVQSDRRRVTEPVRRSISVSRRYLHLPVKTGAPKRRMKYLVDNETVREFDLELAPSSPDFWVFSEMESFRRKTVVIETKLSEEPEALQVLRESDDLPGAGGMYQETYRPQFHFTSRRGWHNDPNGLVWHDGEWHLFYQHNPYGWDWGNMHWSHAVSSNLVHWRELGVALYPRRYDDWAFSGSAVLDSRNTSGWGTREKPALVAAYTSTGRGECIVYSSDRGRTWTEFTGNPVVKHRGRDPRLLWHAPRQQWVMAVYDEEGPKDAKGLARAIAFYTSPDLKRWTFRSRVEGYYECPDLFEIPIEGQADGKWVLYAGDGLYALGRFDGETFVPERPRQRLWHGRFYAAQTFSDPPDGRRIQVGWGQGIVFPGMPFNQQMTLPVELSLRATPDGVRLCAKPVKELASLRGQRHHWTNLVVNPGTNPLAGLRMELLEVQAEIEPGAAKTVGFILRGTRVTWDGAKQQLSCGKESAPLVAEHGRIRLHVFVDRGSVEVFGNDGRVAISAAALAAPDQQALETVVTGTAARFGSLDVYELRSAWH